MTETLMIVQLIVSLMLIIFVLLQFGKGAEAGLLSSTSDATFSNIQRGNILSKITIVLAILFLGGSINLARIQNIESESSILDSEPVSAPPLNSDDLAPEPQTGSNPTPEVKAKAKGKAKDKAKGKP